MRKQPRHEIARAPDNATVTDSNPASMRILPWGACISDCNAKLLGQFYMAHHHEPAAKPCLPGKIIW